MGGAALEAALITALTFGLIAGSAFAGKPSGGGATGAGKHGGGGTSATIVVPNGVFGQTVTASVSPAGLWVYSSCSQGGKVVYQQYVKSDAGGSALLTLGPTYYWTGGDATCTASAGTFSASGAFQAGGSTTFSVAGS